MKIWIDEVIPADMRNANIITIFKKNARHNVNNYRGISLLAVVDKIVALVMRDPIADRDSAPRITMRLSTKPWHDGYDLRRQTTYGEDQRTTP